MGRPQANHLLQPVQHNVLSCSLYLPDAATHVSLSAEVPALCDDAALDPGLGRGKSTPSKFV